MKPHHLALVVTLLSGCDRPAKGPVVGAGPATQASTSPASSPEQRARCCAQCAAASRRDPAGTDISMESCLRYRGEWNGRTGVDEECARHFEQSPARVGECWALEPATP